MEQETSGYRRFKEKYGLKTDAAAGQTGGGWSRFKQKYGLTPKNPTMEQMQSTYLYHTSTPEEQEKMRQDAVAQVGAFAGNVVSHASAMAAEYKPMMDYQEHLKASGQAVDTSQLVKGTAEYDAFLDGFYRWQGDKYLANANGSLQEKQELHNRQNQAVLDVLPHVDGSSGLKQELTQELQAQMESGATGKDAMIAATRKLQEKYSIDVLRDTIKQQKAKFDADSAALDQNYTDNKMSYWANRMNFSDFESKGKYAPKVQSFYDEDSYYKNYLSMPEAERKPIWEQEVSFADALYESVNGNYLMFIKLNNDERLFKDPMWKKLHKKYQDATTATLQMSQEERQVFNYVFETEGVEKAIEFLNDMAEDLDARFNTYWMQKVAQRAKEDPFWESLGTVAMAPMRAIVGGVGMAEDYLSDGELEKDAWYSQLNRETAVTRGTVGNQIRNSWAGDVGAFLYDAGMSVGDNVMNTVAMGGNQWLSALLTGSDAAVNATDDALNRGLSSDQAMTIGILSGIGETLMEKVSLGTILDKKTLSGNALKNMIKSAGVEGLEEVSTELWNTVADVIIAQDKSKWQMAIDSYKEKGLSEGAAFWRAVGDKAVELGYNFLAGATAGGMMSGGNLVMNAGQVRQSAQTRKLLGKYLNEGVLDGTLTSEQIQGMVNEGLALGKGTGSYALAEKIQTDMSKGKMPKGETLAQLVAQSYTDADGKEGAKPISIPQIDTKQQAGSNPASGVNVRQGSPVAAVGENAAADMVAPEAMDADGGLVPGAAWMKSSTEDAVRNESNNGGNLYEGTHVNGEGISDGGKKRTSGTGAGKQTGGVAGSTNQYWGQSKISRSKATIDRQNRARHLQSISTKELGLEGGTDSKNIKVMPHELWDDEMHSLASRIYNETGKNVTYVLGRMQVQGTNGKTINVRGVISGDNIIVQADNMKLSMDQIADHEAYHAKVSPEIAGFGLNLEIRKHIVETFSEEEFRKVLMMYMDAMDGIYEISEAKTGAEYDKLTWLVTEEIFADAYAGINAFGAHAEKFGEAVNQKMDELYFGKQQAQENGTEEPTGPPRERYSIVDESDDSDYSNTEEDLGVRGSPHNMPRGSRERHAFNRSFANKTADIRDGETREILVFTSDYAYFVSADGYMQGYIESRTAITTKNKKRLEELEARIYGPNSNGRTFDRWTDAVQSYRGRNKRDFSVLRNGGTAESDDRFSPRSQGRIRTGNSEGIEKDSFDVDSDTEATPGALVFDGENAWKIEEDGGASLIRFSVDDSDSESKADAEIQAELESEEKHWKEMWLRDRLGDEGYDAFVQRQQEESRRKKDERNTAAKEKALEKKARNATAKKERMEKWEAGSAKRIAKKETESRPTIAKRDFRRTVLDLFSIPNGKRAEISNLIDHFAERIIKNGVLTEEDRRMFFDRLYQSGAMTVPAEEVYKLGRGHLQGGKIYVSDSIKAEFGDDWNNFRKRAFSAGVYLVSDKTASGIDMWNAELAEILPGLFDSEETDMGRALERIIQIAEEGKDENVSLPEFTARMAGIEHQSESEFLDNMERQLDNALHTFVEKAELETNLKKRAVTERESLSRSNFLARQKLAQERDARREMAQRERDQKALHELQQKTLKNLQWLSKNRNKMPEELRPVAEELLGDLDIIAVGAANEMRWSDRYNTTWRNAVEMYKYAKENDPNFLPSDELEKMMMRLDGSKIEDMDVGALQTLYKALVGLRTEFHNRNNLVNDEMNRLFAEVYTDAKQEIESAPGGYSGNMADKFFNMDQLTPMNVLHRMGGWNPNGTFYSMAKQLENGERDIRAYTIKANRVLEEFLTEHQDFVKRADGQGKDAIWYEVEVPELLELGMGDKPIFGNTVKVYMTPAQKVHLYLESKNLDNLRHMTGGRTFADKELYSKGKRQEAFAQGKTIRLAPETVKKLVSDLTAEELELAEVLERYYNTFATKEINRVSNVLYGYDKAMGKNYAPIYTNRNYTKSEFGVFDATAEGVGNLKERQTAKNPTYNIGAFDAFERHVDQTARFVGMAIPARNWTNLMNWREKNNSTGDVITHKWGEEGKKYITDLLTTLQGGDDVKTDTVSNFANKAMSNYIAAIFGFNPSIVLKQLGSIPMASAYLGIGNVPSPAKVWNIDKDLIAKYTQDLAWRTMGYATPETKQLKENPNWTQTNKVVKYTFGGGAITAMDGWAASTLWPWAENKVRKQFPDLEIGTAAQVQAGESPFYKKVAEEFEQAMSRSQSVSDEMHQGRLRKSKNPVTRAFTMFRSDSAQTYNAIRQKIGEANYYARNGKKGPAHKAACKAAGAAFLAMVTNALWAEAIDFLMALWKNKGKKYRDEDEELTAQSVIGEMVTGFVDSLAGVTTGGEELAQIIGNIITGDTWYGIDTPGGEQLNDIIDSIISSGKGMKTIVEGAADVVKNGGDLGAYLSKHSADILGNIKELAETAGMYVAGLPVSNLETYLLGLVKWVSPELGVAYDDLFSSVNKKDLSGLTGEALNVRIDNIFSAKGSDVSENAVSIISDIYEAGYTDAVPSATPSQITVKGESRPLTAYQQQLFENKWSSIVSDTLNELVELEIFNNADLKTQSKVLHSLYDYAAAIAKSKLFEDYELPSSAVRVQQIVDEGVSLAECFAMTTSVAERYIELISKGLDEDDAYELVQALDDLEPETGTDKVTDVQRWRACVEFSYKPGTQLAALAGVMDDAQLLKARVAYEMDVNPDTYVTLKERLPEYDLNHDGSMTNAEVKAAVDSMKGLSYKQKAVLWQLNVNSKSAKNNPYSTVVGQQVLDAKNEG